MLTFAATWNIDAPAAMREGAVEPSNTTICGRVAFWQALRQVWAEPAADRFTAFVFVSMLAYSLQDLLLEPFAGLVFGFAPGESTQLVGIQHSGVLIGVLLAAAAGSLARGRGWGSLRAWTIGGCISSALALMGLAMGALIGDSGVAYATVFGAEAGLFLIAAAIALRLDRSGARSTSWTEHGRHVLAGADHV